jgi:hypothetical protein
MSGRSHRQQWRRLSVIEPNDNRWLAACVDSNGTVQAVYFFKKNLDFTADEYTDMNQVMPEGNYTWETRDMSQLKGTFPRDIAKRFEIQGAWQSGEYIIRNTIMRAGESANSKFNSQSDIYGRGYYRWITSEMINKTADELDMPELKVTPDNDRWLSVVAGGALLFALAWSFWPKKNQFRIPEG